MYDPGMVQPMRDEMTQAGFTELRTAEEVDALVAEKDSTKLIFINSVCGCAAGIARPALIESLKNEILPQNLTTAFAGNDVEAVDRAREHFVGYAPSSPCMAVFRDGKLVHIVERHHIEGQTVETLSKVLTSAYDRYCGEQIDESVKIYDPLAELEITVEEAKQQISENSELAVLDLRAPNETEQGKIEGALMVDEKLGQEIVSSWPRDREIIVYCQHGQRSLTTTQFLKTQGFQKVHTLKGGFEAWQNS